MKEYKEGTIMEKEDTYPAYLHIILKGEVALMKKPENLYDA